MQEHSKNRKPLIILLFLPLVFGMSPVEIDPVGKIRDPFKSPFAVELMRAPELPSSPLLNYDLPELKLVGIVWGELGRAAVVEAPDGKCYLVKRGEEIGKMKGRVIEIGNDHINIQTIVTDYLGRTKTEETTVRLYKEGTPVPAVVSR
ncbi:MAG: pilus assembly protein PilP [bacterium]